VWRRLGRSILALIAMAIAAAVLTSGLSLSRGLPKLALSHYRQLFGGEIVVFTPGFYGSGLLEIEDSSLVKRQVIDSGFSPLLKYFPVLREGYYADSSHQYRPFSEADIAGLLQVPGISGTSSVYSMPGALEVPESSLTMGRPRTAQVDYRPLPGELWPDEDPFTYWDYDFDVVLNSYGLPQAEVGHLVTVTLPFYRFDNYGIPYVDSSLPSREYVARVVGRISIPTRSITWVGEQGAIFVEQGYLHSPEVFLSESTWGSLWQEHSGGQAFPKLYLGLTVDNMAELNVTKRQLQEQYPQFAFFTIADFVRHLESHAILDRFYRAPPTLWRPEFQPTHPMARQDFGTITAALMFLNAGMLLASQMLTAIAGRRNEIGILKAIGARNRDVVGMILLEAVIIAVIGATCGFTLVRAAGIHLSFTNNIPLMEIIATTLKELSLVLGLTLAASLLFGVLPAWKVAKLTVMEVFRND
jgi:hypothetical protein